MKKNAVSFCVMMLLGLSLLVNAGIVSGYQAGYEVNNYTITTLPTMDGHWTAEQEWNDTEIVQLDGSLDAEFRPKYDGGYPDYVYQYYLIEFFDDTTEDAGDYLEISYECPTGIGGTPIGGTTPQTDCTKFRFEGYSQTGLSIYNGDGTQWVETTGYTWQTDIEIIASISATPSDSTPHRVIEVKLDNLYFSFGTPQWVRICVYDASQSAAGEQAWPDSSANAPDEWGLIEAIQSPIPEGLTFAVMVFMSSIALLVGSRYLQKRSKKQET